MAITRYAGDRFTIADGETKPTGVLDGAYLIDTGNLTQFVKRTVGGTSQWSQLAGGGGGGTPGGANTQVQFNNGGSFGGDADLTFTNGNRLNVNKLGISGNIYDSNNFIGEGGMVLTNEGTTGVNWKSIESVLSGVGGSGVANYVARWSDEDTLTSGTIYDNGDVGIGTANPGGKLHVFDTVVSDMVILESSGPSAADGPDVVFYRNSASPADNDDLGKLVFRGRNDNSQDVNYANIIAEAIDVSDGTEDGALKFYTYLTGANTETMVLRSANVGIGTDSPNTRLHVEDSTSNTTATKIRVQGGSLGFTLGKAQTADHYAHLRPLADNAMALRVMPNGTTVRESYVEVWNKDYENGANSTSWHRGMFYIDTSNDVYLRADGYGTAGSVFIGTENNTQTLMVKDGGKVGIGTVTPAVPLHITKSAVGDNEIPEVIRLSTLNSASPSWSTTDGLCIGAEMKKANGTTITKQPIRFRYDGGDMATTLEEGKVGIGTASPSSLLELYSSAPELTIKDGGTWGTNATAYINLKDSSSSMAYIGVTGTAGHLDIKQLKAGSLRLYTNNSERLTIISDGNVGIGTNAPAGKLEIVGSNGTVTGTPDGDAEELVIRNNDRAGIQILSANNGYGSLIFGSASDINGANIFYAPAATLLTIGTQVAAGEIALRTANGAEAVRIDADGNVGIGDNLVDPEHRLHVSGDAIISGYLYDSTNSTGADGYVLTSKEDGPQWKLVEDVLSGVGGSGTANYVSKWVDSDTIGNSIIYDDGDVGISTASPDAKLHVFDTTVADLAIFETNNPNSSNGPDVVLYRSSASPADADDLGRIAFRGKNDADQDINYANIIGEAIDVSDGTEDGALRFNTYLTGVSTETMVLRSANVGIGTNAPGSKLDVIGTTTVRYAAGDFSTKRLDIQAANTSNVIQSVTNPLHIYDNSAIRICMLQGGSVGIGTNAPESLLHLQGSIPTIILHDTDTAVSGDDYGKIQWHTKDASMPGTDDIGAEIKATDDSTYGDRAALLFSTAHNATSLTERMRIASNGNVGIGTNAPASLLHVGGAAASPHAAADDFVIAPAATDVGMTIRCNSNSGTGSIFFADTAANAQGLIRYNHNTDYMSFYSSGDFFFDTGSVGIGTVAPGKKLQISAGDGDHLLLQYSGSTSNSGAVRQLFQRSTGTEASPTGTSDGDVIGTTSYVAYAPSGSTYRNSAAIIVTRHGAANTVSAPAKIALATPGTGDDTLVDRLTILPGGSVGIGTNAPSRPLEVIGTGSASVIRVGDGDSDGNASVSYIEFGANATSWNRQAYIGPASASNSHLWIVNEENADILFYANNDEKMVIKNDGKVGIGTATPYRNTHIYQAADSDNFEGALQVGGTGAAVGGYFGYNSTSSGRLTISSLNNAGGANAKIFLGFGLDGDGSPATEVMILNQDGNVGIGTNVVNADVEVSKSSTTNGPVIRLANRNDSISAGGTHGAIEFFSGDNSNPADQVVSSIKSIHVATAPNYGELAFSTGSNSEAVRINLSGSVGIGTNAPSRPLHVYVTSGNNYLTVQNTSTSQSALQLMTGTTDANWLMYIPSSSTDLRLYRGADKVVFKADGNVGIGVSPAYKLQVLGDIYMNGGNFLMDHNYEIRSKDSGGTTRTIVRVNSNVLQYGWSGSGNVLFMGGGSYTERMRINASGGAITFNNAFTFPTADGSANQMLKTDGSGNLSWTSAGTGTITGSGSANYIPKFTGSSAIGNSTIATNGEDVAIGSTEYGVGGTIDLSIGNPGNTAGGITLWNTTTGTHSIGFGDANSGTARYEGYLEYAHADNSMRLGTLHAERMRITSAGKVLINATAPTLNTGSTLYVNGNAYASEFELPSGGKLDWANGDATIEEGLTSNYSLSLRNYDGSSAMVTTMFLKSGGSVGIGTDAPAALLNLFKTGANDAVSSAIYLQRAAGNYGAAILQVGNGSSGSEKLMFTAGHNSDPMAISNAKMTIQQDGNVGIGTSAPGSLFNVYVASQRQLDFYGGTSPSGNNYVSALKLGRGKASSSALEIKYDSEGTEHAYISRLYTNAVLHFDKAGTDHMTILADGKVGIGTDAPSELLEVKGNLTLRGATNLRYKIANDSNNNWAEIGNDGATGENTLEFFTGSSSVPSMSITNSKLVGIGTATPVYTLQANGTNGGIIGVTRTTGNTTGVLGHVRFGNTDVDSDLANIEGVQDGATDSARLEFQTQATGGSATARMTIKSTGLIGIGTDDPGGLLEVYGASGAVLSHVKSGSVISRLTANSTTSDGTVGTSSTHDFLIQRAGSTRITLSGSSVVVNDSGEDIDFRVEGDTDTNLIRTDAANERVGIGTNAPSSKLHVNSEISCGADDNNRAMFGYTPSRFYLGTRQSGTNYLNTVSVTSGKVGIGTNSPSGKLTIKSSGNSSYGLEVQSSLDADKIFGVYQDGDGDGALYLFNKDAASTVGLSSVGSSWFTGGSVGIGTNNPDSKLEIAGGGYNSSLKIKGSGADTGIQFEDSGGTTDGYIYAAGDSIGILDSGTDWTIQCKNDDYIRFCTNGATEHMRITSAGSVGIGTDAPVTLLDVYHATHSQITISSAGNQDSSLSLIEQSTSAPFGSASVYGFQWKYDGGDNKLYLSSGVDTNVVNRLTVQRDDGNVGIGTVAPASKLHLYSASDSNTIVKLQGGSDTNKGAYINFLRGTTDVGSFGTKASLIGGTSNDLMFYSASNDFIYYSTAEIMRITSTGSVGMGTNAPSNRLHVEGNTLATASIRIEKTTTGINEDPGLVLAAANNTDGYRIGSIFFQGGATSYAQIRAEMNGTAGAKIYFVAGSQTNPVSNSSTKTLEIEDGIITAATTIRPLTDSSYTLGQASLKWSELYVDKIKDVNNSTGSANQVLSAGGSGGSLDWISLSDISGVDGSGTANKVAKWTDGDTIGNSQITDNGTSVGINQGSPSAANKLEVSGTVTCSSQLISAQGYTQPPVGTLTIQGPTNGGSTLNSDVWGLVIGPQHTRSATANTYYAGIAFNHLLNHTGQSTYNNVPQAWIGTRLHDTSGSERDFLVFATKSGTGLTSSDVPVERMCIDPVDGNVGIGTTDPSTILEVGGDADVYGLIGRAKIGTMGHTDYAGFSHRDTGGTGNYALLQATGGATFLNAASGQTIYFRVNNSDTMYMTSTQLQFNDNKKVILGNDSDLEIYHDGSNNYIKSLIANGDLILDTAQNFYLKHSGETMLQGVNDGALKLFHNGIEKLETTSGGVTVTGTLTETSSITLKENVETYTPSLDIINKIRPVKYNRKTNKDKKEIGLIAEELAELFPELVEKDEKGNPSSVNYSRAVTVLLGGFKELYKEIEELKKRI